MASCLASPSSLETNLPVVADLRMFAAPSVPPAGAAAMNLPVAPDRRGFLLPLPPLKNLSAPTPRPGSAVVEPKWNFGDLLGMLSPSGTLIMHFRLHL